MKASSCWGKTPSCNLHEWSQHRWGVIYYAMKQGAVSKSTWTLTSWTYRPPEKWGCKLLPAECGTRGRRRETRHCLGPLCTIPHSVPQTAPEAGLIPNFGWRSSENGNPDKMSARTQEGPMSAIFPSFFSMDLTCSSNFLPCNHVSQAAFSSRAQKSYCS